MPIFLFSCGSNAQGQLANGTIEDSHSFEPCIFSEKVTVRRIIQLACGGNHTLLLAEVVDAVDGPESEARVQLYGCGDNAVGQLGIGESSSSVFRPIDIQLNQNGLENYRPRLICASWQTTYIVLSCPGKPDYLITMGGDDFGDLGIGGNQTTPKVSESRIPFFFVRLNHLMVNDSQLEDREYLVVKAIAAGQHHVIAQLHARFVDGSYHHLTIGWGTCRHGQLGPVEEVLVKGRKKTPAFLNRPRVILSDQDYRSIACGNQHSVLMNDSGAAIGLGSNKRNQLDGLDGLDTVEVGSTWNGTYVVDRIHRKIHATGSYTKGQLGRSYFSKPSSTTPQFGPVEFAFDVSSNSTSHRLGSLACGSEHVLSLWNVNDCSEVWGWGWNEHGNLGLGSTEDAHLPVKIWPPEQSVEHSHRDVVGVWAGCGTSWIAVGK
ncbi:alpha tubulin suppressor [Marasmius tenuissimus]|uniref:Alpha tubulin suppressor n=1 Tax=Marasmius tenuissimus TaxID=585030 RepID=A0ABR2ZLQ6_9AGAR